MAAAVLAFKGRPLEGARRRKQPAAACGWRERYAHAAVPPKKTKKTLIGRRAMVPVAGDNPKSTPKQPPLAAPGGPTFFSLDVFSDPDSGFGLLREPYPKFGAIFLFGTVASRFSILGPDK